MALLPTSSAGMGPKAIRFAHFWDLPSHRFREAKTKSQTGELSLSKSFLETGQHFDSGQAIKGVCVHAFFPKKRETT